MDSITKICKKCGKVKSIDEFPKRKLRNGCFSTRGSCNFCWINHVVTWNKTNKERRKEISRNSAKKQRNTPEGKIKEAQKRKDSKEQRRDYLQSWRHNNIDKWHAQDARNNHKRRTRVKNTQNTLTIQEWKEIIERQKNICLSCKRPFSEELKPTRDHIIPVSKGGSLTKENVQALCRPCNSSKFNKIIDFR